MQSSEELKQLRQYGPAFPVDMNLVNWTGITMRDWFATFAMRSICASDVFPDLTFDDAASDAYKMADAMLKARGGDV